MCSLVFCHLTFIHNGPLILLLLVCLIDDVCLQCPDMTPTALMSSCAALQSLVTSLTSFIEDMKCWLLLGKLPVFIEIEIHHREGLLYNSLMKAMFYIFCALSIHRHTQHSYLKGFLYCNFDILVLRGKHADLTRVGREDEWAEKDEVLTN